jgi:long-chain acyl-CoA synthetase
MPPPRNTTAHRPAEAQGASEFATLAALAASLGSRGDLSALVAFGGDGSETLSYAELGEAVASTARGLRAAGIDRGERVALLGPNSPDWIVAYLGAVAAGAIAMPLDPQAAAETTEAALAHAEPKAVIATRALAAALEPRLGAHVRRWLLDERGEHGVRSLRAHGGTDELPALRGDDVASLHFTSGTTGVPKAVPLTHANLVANLRALLAARLVAERDRVLLPLPLHHTYPSTVGLLLPLAAGATIVLPAGLSGPEILEACRAARPTALLAVPRLCAALVDGIRSGVEARGRLAARTFAALLEASILLRRYTGLRVGRALFGALHARLGGALEIIGCGGAKLPDELAWQLEGLGFRVLTGYGLTETSPVLTFNSVRRSRLGSEGQPLAGVELRIAGATGDAPGEILARGPSVFAGYWRNPDATAEAFRADGWFRTGDLGRIDADGFLHVVGRTKELIVLADGKKFFPEPVEQVYAASPLLREIGVFERGGVLAAVVVPDEDEVRRRGALRETAELRDELETLGSRLPPHQRITSFRAVRTPLPRTQLGKLRRHLLPAIFVGAAVERSVDAAALPEADRELLVTPLGEKLWRWLNERFPDQALTLDTSPQLELNIDSLGWVSLTVEIERRFGVALKAERLARILSLRDLVREVDAAARAGETPAAAAPAAFAPPGPALRVLGACLFAAARALARLALKPEISGVDRLPQRASLIAPNHTSYLDPLVIAAALPWRRLRRTYWAGAAAVMHSTWLRRLVSRATQVFAVDPERDLTGAIRTARELLARGYDVVWFPEGRRSPTGELQPLEAGAGVLAQGAAAAVVPVAIAGTYAAWPRHKRWPRPARVRVAFGTPLDGAGAREPRELTAALERALRALLEDCSRGIERSPP